jgi:hypothetical protein
MSLTDLPNKSMNHNSSSSHEGGRTTTTSIAIIAIVAAALALLGVVVVVTIVTIPLQQQAEARGCPRWGKSDRRNFVLPYSSKKPRSNCCRSN